MNRTPKGCSSIGGPTAMKMEWCRGAAMGLFSRYGYHPFSPPELQLLEDVWGNISPVRARRLIPVMSPLGEPCVMRGDITLSAAAYLGSHFSDTERPLRLSYAERVFAAPQSPKNNIEESQVGVEFIGTEEKGADAECAALILRTLDELCVLDYTIVLGDVSIFHKFFAGMDNAGLLVEALASGSYTEYFRLLNGEKQNGQCAFLRKLPFLKGAKEVLAEAAALSGDRSLFEPLRSLASVLAALGYEDRMRIDLGFVRDLGYYSGPIYNIYSSDGSLLGGGGRYDALLKREGLDGIAAGFALNLKELADHCMRPDKSGRFMLWGGSADTSELLRYADCLSGRGGSFELSWSADAESSASSARLRGYGWWVDFASKKAADLNTGRQIPLSEFESEVL